MNEDPYRLEWDNPLYRKLWFRVYRRHKRHGKPLGEPILNEVASLMKELELKETPPPKHEQSLKGLEYGKESAKTQVYDLIQIGDEVIPVRRKKTKTPEYYAW